MNTETFKKAGICFRYCSKNFEVPSIQDVLVALRLSGEDSQYSDCRKWWDPEIYAANVHRAAVAASFGIMARWPYDEAAARKIIAEAILDLWPLELKCLFSAALAEVAEVIMGQQAPSKTTDHETLLQACGCPECRGTLGFITQLKGPAFM